ncbi:MAG TPA: VOC family protein [Dehalococcoidia bacterium]|jgi:predicted enzyme related to lactoylglutathione lyase
MTSKITALSFLVPVTDLDRAMSFYREAFGLEEVFRNEGVVFAGIPGGDSAVGLLLQPEAAGGGPMYVGLHLDHALDLDEVTRGVVAAGGTLVERGQHAPDVPFARIQDLDGNELWV